LISAITIASVLNMIPLASLAAILLMVGYKLAKPGLFMQMYKLGWEQFIPFLATVIGILATDLLKGYHRYSGWYFLLCAIVTATPTI
jgi:SulP family sulfate permease